MIPLDAIQIDYQKGQAGTTLEEPEHNTIMEF
jgi:hypothetical protein